MNFKGKMLSKGNQTQKATNYDSIYMIFWKREKLQLQKLKQ